MRRSGIRFRFQGLPGDDMRLAGIQCLAAADCGGSVDAPVAARRWCRSWPSLGAPGGVYQEQGGRGSCLC